MVFVIYYIVLHAQYMSLNNILSSIQVFLPFITAFSFSALIALPSINNSKMDEVQKVIKNGDVVKLEIHHKYRGQHKVTELTNKMFLSIMLGYISFVSSLLFIFSIILSGTESTFFITAEWYIRTNNFSFIGYFFDFLYYFVCIVFIWGVASIVTSLMYAVRIFTTSSCDIY
jgi:hypothetical protein